MISSQVQIFCSKPRMRSSKNPTSKFKSWTNCWRGILWRRDKLDLNMKLKYVNLGTILRSEKISCLMRSFRKRKLRGTVFASSTSQEKLIEGLQVWKTKKVMQPTCSLRMVVYNRGGCIERLEWPQTNISMSLRRSKTFILNGMASSSTWLDLLTSKCWNFQRNSKKLIGECVQRTNLLKFSTLSSFASEW